MVVDPPFFCFCFSTSGHSSHFCFSHLDHFLYILLLIGLFFLFQLRADIHHFSSCVSYIFGPESSSPHSTLHLIYIERPLFGRRSVAFPLFVYYFSDWWRWVGGWVMSTLGDIFSFKICPLSPVPMHIPPFWPAGQPLFGVDFPLSMEKTKIDFNLL